MDDPHDEEIIRSVPCVRLEGSVGRKEEDLVPVEEAFAIRINGEQAVEVTISPREIGDFVLGHLVCQGFIRSPSQVMDLKLCRGSADVTVAPGGEEGHGLDPDFRVNPEAVREAVAAVQQSRPHALTGGFHVCGLFVPVGSGVRRASLCEDVGRHAALDKAVGCALRLGFDPSRCFLATTGRISSEMVSKCHRAGLALIASRGATTTLAIDMAKVAGITLVGFARGERMNLYANDWRLVGEP